MIYFVKSVAPFHCHRMNYCETLVKLPCIQIMDSPSLYLTMYKNFLHVLRQHLLLSKTWTMQMPSIPAQLNRLHFLQNQHLNFACFYSRRTSCSKYSCFLASLSSSSYSFFSLLASFHLLGLRWQMKKILPIPLTFYSDASRRIFVAGRFEIRVGHTRLRHH